MSIAAVYEFHSTTYMWSYEMFFDIASVFCVIPTFLNNFLYVWQLPDFNRAFKRMIKCSGETIANSGVATVTSTTNRAKQKTND